jgi:hypothetical protein
MPRYPVSVLAKALRDSRPILGGNTAVAERFLPSGRMAVIRLDEPRKRVSIRQTPSKRRATLG